MDTVFALLFMLVAIAPFLIAAALAWAASRTSVALLRILLAAIAGSALVTVLGAVLFIALYNSQAAGSQALGFVFLPLLLGWLVFSCHTGAVAGAWWAASRYRQEATPALGSFHSIASAAFAALLASSLPFATAAAVSRLSRAIAAIVPGTSATLGSSGLDETALLGWLILSSASGIASAVLGTKLALWLF